MARLRVPNFLRPFSITIKPFIKSYVIMTLFPFVCTYTSDIKARKESKNFYSIRFFVDFPNEIFNKPNIIINFQSWTAVKHTQKDWNFIIQLLWIELNELGLDSHFDPCKSRAEFGFIRKLRSLCGVGGMVTPVKWLECLVKMVRRKGT